MKQIIAIDTSLPKGQMLLELLKEFKNSKFVTFLTESALEEKEDKVLLDLMEKDRKSGKADTKNVLKKLNVK